MSKKKVEKKSKKAIVKNPLGKKQALKKLVELRNPQFVMNQPMAMSGNELLEITHAIGEHPYSKKMGIEEYEHEKHLLQTELLKVQSWVKEH